MVLHLGSNIMVHKDKIIAILDLETTRNSQISRHFINNILKGGKIQNIAEQGKEKSFVICDTGYYLSPISSSTLLKRSTGSNDFDTLESLKK
ncbi:MAG: hypothetical protein AWM53_01151 [Candidatus Dichloromethanomonas elyunquensis]|nr:MAG: hypothetical protein AWM53_01151 [Candidatus Dichloromethanomonas elyunquensis]